MIELGYKPIQIWLAPEMREMLHQAAEDEQLPDAAFAKEVITNHLIAESRNQEIWAKNDQDK
jgi:hypothetical protein